jgi:serine protease
MTSYLPIARRRLLLPFLIVAFVLSAASAADAARHTGATRATAATHVTPRTGRLLVTVDRGRQSRATTDTLRGLGVRKDGEQVPQVGLVTVRPLAGETLAAAAARMRTLPWVKSVSVERRMAYRFVPNDPSLTQFETATGTPPGTPKEWWAASENLFAGWDITNGTGAKVAIIDSGIDGNHPEFAGKIIAAYDNDSTFGGGPANYDPNGHGTHVASLACANGNNSAGIVGSGLNCGLIIMKSDLSDSSIIQSLVQASDAGADAINMSFGTDGSIPPPPAFVSALNYAISKNVVLVAAAANEPVEEQGDPANVLQPTGTGPDITFNKGLSVTSADYSHLRSSFAGKGSQISIAGHGNFAGITGPIGILGAWPANTTQIDAEGCGCRTSVNGDNRYAYLAGTSMATPQVAGVAALVAHLNPDLSAAEVVRILKQTATRPAGTGWGSELGWGIVNLGAAVNAARVIDRFPPRSKARGPKKLKKSRRFTLKWTGKDVSRPGIVPAGILRYEIFRKKNSGGYHRVAKTTKKKRKFTLKRGARYRFYTIAVDKQGNREAKPSKPDVSLRVTRSR